MCISPLQHGPPQARIGSFIYDCHTSTVMTTPTLNLPGYDSLRPGHLYARPSPRARAPPLHEALCLWRATYRTPDQMTETLAALAQLTLDGESPLSGHPPLAHELASLSKRELKAIAKALIAPMPNLRSYLGNVIPVQCPQQRAEPIRGLCLLVAHAPAASVQGLAFNDAPGYRTNAERELLAIVDGDAQRSTAWSITAGWTSEAGPLSVISASRVLENRTIKATDADHAYLTDIVRGMEQAISDPAVYNTLPDSTGSHEADALTVVLRVTREYRSSGKISKRDWQRCLGLRSGTWPSRIQPHENP